MTIAAEDLPRIAELDSVKSIEPLHPVVFGSDLTRAVLKVEGMNQLPGLASPEGLTGNIIVPMCFLSPARSDHRYRFRHESSGIEGPIGWHPFAK